MWDTKHIKRQSFSEQMTQHELKFDMQGLAINPERETEEKNISIPMNCVVLSVLHFHFPLKAGFFSFKK